MFGWWSELPAWIRLGSGLLMMLVGGGILAAGLLGYLEPGFRVVPRFSLVMLAVGLGLFAVGSKSDSEKNGYRF